MWIAVSLSALIGTWILCGDVWEEVWSGANGLVADGVLRAPPPWCRPPERHGHVLLCAHPWFGNVGTPFPPYSFFFNVNCHKPNSKHSCKPERHIGGTYMKTSKTTPKT